MNRVIITLPEDIEQALIPRLTVAQRSMSRQVRAAIHAAWDNRCVFCGSTERLEIDHIHPVDAGGDNAISNLTVLCQTCNSVKKATLLDADVASTLHFEAALRHEGLIGVNPHSGRVCLASSLNNGRVHLRAGDKGSLLNPIAAKAIEHLRCFAAQAERGHKLTRLALRQLMGVDGEALDSLTFKNKVLDRLTVQTSAEAFGLREYSLPGKRKREGWEKF